MNKQYKVGAVVFDGFELLDMFGPLEMLGLLPENFELHMVAEKTGPVASAQGPNTVATAAFSDSDRYEILLIPGGRGTRVEVENSVFLQWLRSQAGDADFVTSVCTGSALLARAGLLDGVRATTNKAAFEWVTSQGENVDWVKQARWVEDGKFFTSSGVSAGIDMTLALIARILGQPQAEEVAKWAEYDWHEDASWDPFAKIHNLV
ncbi:MAG: DJ-1/PfpI family protein [Pseudomonadota bacterium]